MKTQRRQRDPFRWKSTSLLIGIAVVGLLILRQTRAALGLALGFALYAANLLVMLEIGRSLLRRDETSRPKGMAALSSAGRLSFLAIALAIIALLLGKDAVLGACGGLLIAQVNLHVPKLGH